MAPLKTSTIGFPRIGPNRELKKALESHWKGDSSLDQLLEVSKTVERDAWSAQDDAGVDLIGLDGTLYDQILDFIFYLGLVPERFQGLKGYELYFAMARGAPGATALDMSKFFDTNYHQLVPELSSSSTPKADFTYLIEKVKRGQEVVGKAKAVPIVIGPITLVSTAKATKLDVGAVVSSLVPEYVQLLKQLKELGVPEVQVHEPILVAPEGPELQKVFESTFAEFSKAGVPINLVTYFDDVGETYPWVVKLPVAAVSLDFLGVPGAASGCATAQLIAEHGFPSDKRLGAGVIDGRSIWKDDGSATAFVSALLAKGVTNVTVQTSASLQLVPYDKQAEKQLPSEVHSRLSFAVQKLEEMVTVAKEASASSSKVPLESALKTPGDSQAGLDKGLFTRSKPYAERRDSQIKTPAFPTTTIGSFPQTPEIRRARLQFKKGQLSEAEYERHVNEYMEFAIREQEAMGMDVLVHGEPERTDMVEYFGVKLDGFCFTENGWVQSYGSRYVRPPIIHADISRPAAMTVKEFAYAQKLTKKPVKGMLTGPVTILNWSFPRKDITRRTQAFQLGLALRGEVADLEKAGCAVIQVDEPALREGLPLKKERWNSYLDWAVQAFRLATVVAAPTTQIVTHLCYSEFADILQAIDGLDADVLTIENSRSGDEMVVALAKYGYGRDLGAGVYDVHSPVVPSVEFMTNKLRGFLKTGILDKNAEHIWVNPDCGLKTREWQQVLPALKNMISAAKSLRAEA
ncbi:hypothetical protein WJX73_002072 [Symbiochloris irregularis]|uniref:5-methyltetrahydropteroyltriglutamate--homocysteine S-methyltransferase n=1 Tax=Symbiochloris irregularis TaxID=706552 RepID=A0AAW1PTA5_9CHLO